VTRFNEFERSIPGISRSVLAQRLRRLDQLGVISRQVDSVGRTTDYRLTTSGREVGNVVAALGQWGIRWLVPDGGPADIDPDGLMRWMRRHVFLDELPPQRVVIRFELRAKVTRFFWLILQPGDVSLCPEDPGFGEDLWATAEPNALYRVVAGSMALRDAVDDGRLRLDGPPSLTNAFAAWFGLNRPVTPSPGPSGP
jgi:hypothetical protein